jgi:hypothetical protein
MVKQGVNFGTVGPTGNLGITFNIFDEEGGLIIDFEGGQTVRLSDIRKALEISLRVTWLTFSVGQEAQAVG